MTFTLEPSTIAGTGLGSLFLIYVARKWFVTWMFDKTHLQSTKTITAQFATLQASIEANRQEITVLRTEQQRMDKVVHSQQRTITRMEMLLRQFSGLMQDNGITVPVHLQAELTDLLKSDFEASKQ